MKTKLRRVEWLAIFLVAPCGTPAAELGDVNGDGRVSFADALHFAHHVELPGGQVPPLAAGSADFETVFPCTLSGFQIVALIEMEGLRRRSAAPLPHFIEDWPPPAGPQAAPPAATSEVVVEVLPLRHDGPDGKLALQVRLTTFAPVLGLHLVLEAAGLELRPPSERDNEAKMFSTGEYTLVTGGKRLVYHTLFTLFRARTPGFEIGEHVLEVPAEVQRGTPDGDWELRLVEGTEAVVGDMDSPRVVVPETTSGTIHIRGPIVAGFAQPFPPLRFDEAARRVLGVTELRMTPVSGRIGEEVTSRLQGRTERPINHLNVSALFDGRVLQCTEATPLLARPETGSVDPEILSLHIGKGRPRNGEGFGAVYMDLDLTRRGYSIYDLPWIHGSRTPGLEYVAPSGEWQDLAELKFIIRASADGRGYSPLKPWLYYTPDTAIFLPYPSQGTIGAGDVCDEHAAWWANETTTVSSECVVTDSGPPRELELPVPIEAADIRYAIGRAEGRPGEVARLPVTLETEVELFCLWHVIHFDQERLELLGFDAPFIDPHGNPIDIFVSPESWSASRPVECQRDEQGILFDCLAGYPDSATLRGSWHGAYGAEVGDFVPPAIVIARLLKNAHSATSEPERRLWGPGARHLTMTLVFRIRDDAAPGEAVVENVEVDWQPFDQLVPWTLGSGGVPASAVGDQSLERYDVPARSVVAGGVRVLGEPVFLRGDANQDGKLDVSDAVRTLGTLFLGVEILRCLDAADADDNGLVNLTDAVYSLDHLFRGGPALPPPNPEQGRDPTVDELRCGS